MGGAKDKRREGVRRDTAKQMSQVAIKVHAMMLGGGF